LATDHCGLFSAINRLNK